MLDNSTSFPYLALRVEKSKLFQILFLLNSFCNIGHPLQKSDTPLHQATKDGNLEIMKLLINAKANVNAPAKVRVEGE
tara:strand:+ start:1421 stop:1654 length:234 start_codon:yes stop_codon:yes gene_type:complete